MTLYTVTVPYYRLLGRKKRFQEKKKLKHASKVETVRQLFIFSHVQPKLMTTQPRGSPGGGTP